MQTFKNLQKPVTLDLESSPSYFDDSKQITYDSSIEEQIRETVVLENKVLGAQPGDPGDANPLLEIEELCR